MTAWVFLALSLSSNPVVTQIGPFQSLALCTTTRATMDDQFNASVRRVRLSTCFSVVLR